MKIRNPRRSVACRLDTFPLREAHARSESTLTYRLVVLDERHPPPFFNLHSTPWGVSISLWSVTVRHPPGTDVVGRWENPANENVVRIVGRVDGGGRGWDGGRGWAWCD